MRLSGTLTTTPDMKTSAPTQTGGSQGTLGPHTAQPTRGQTIGRNIADFFKGIGKAFVSLHNRVQAHQAKTKLASDTRAANNSAKNLIKGLGKEHSDIKMASAMPNLLAKAAKLDPHNPVGKARELVQNVLAGMTPQQRMAFNSTDFTKMEAVIHRVLDHTMGRGAAVEQALVDTGLGKQDEVTTDAHVTETKTNVTLLLAAMKQASVQTLLPEGVDVDDNGYVRGAVDIKAKNVVGQGPVLVGVAIQDTVDERIEGKSKQGFKNVGGIEVHSEFLADALRMNFAIDGKKTNVHVVSSTEGRNAGELDVAQKLSDFAETANATKVLSAACHQGLFNNFVSTMSKSDGEAIKFGMPHKGAGNNDCTFTDQLGNKHNVGVPSQFAGVDVKLDKYPNGDFKMTVDWETFFSRVIGGEETADGKMQDKSYYTDAANPKDVLKMTTSCEIRIDKTAADRGEFVFSFEQTPLAAFEGKVG